MLTLALTKNLYSFKKPQTLSYYSKKIFSVNNYLGRTSYYKSILYKYVNFCAYINIFNSSSILTPINTGIEIQPQIIGADAKKITAKFGKPVFILNENRLTIFVYKLKFNGLKTRCEIHFYNNRVFLINYHYSKLNDSEKGYILKSITDKYINLDIDIRDRKIIDSNNNTVYINDILEGINITYLSCRESGWYCDLINEVNAREEKQNNRMMLEKRLFYNSI